MFLLLILSGIKDKDWKIYMNKAVNADKSVFHIGDILGAYFVSPYYMLHPDEMPPSDFKPESEDIIERIDALFAWMEQKQKPVDPVHIAAVTPSVKLCLQKQFPWLEQQKFPDFIEKLWGNFSKYANSNTGAETDHKCQEALNIAQSATNDWINSLGKEHGHFLKVKTIYEHSNLISPSNNPHL